MSNRPSNDSASDLFGGHVAGDPFARIDPFVALMDGRQQFIAAVTDALASATVEAARIAAALARVAAHDEALTAVALAFGRGERDFSLHLPPTERTLLVADLDAAMQYRGELFDALAAIGDALDEELETPWGGLETWRMHLVSLAMHDGAQAHALRAHVEGAR